MKMRRTSAVGLAVATVFVVLAGCTGAPDAQTISDTPASTNAGSTARAIESTRDTGGTGSAEVTSTDSVDPAQAAAIHDIVTGSMSTYGLKAAIVKVTVNGENILTEAMGESMTGVPATTDMHFRNGAVAISYIATLLLELVDEGEVSLDDRVSTWLPDLPHADEVTLGQLAAMTSGYPDYVTDPDFLTASSTDVFRSWQPEELLGYVTDQPLLYQPDTNWSYSHTNYVILGLALEKITGLPMSVLMQRKVLDPLGLTDTTDPLTAAVPDPVLHAFNSERREFFGVPPENPFYEESTFWNPTWTLARGAAQTTDINDLNTSAIAIGTGELLSPASYQLMISPKQRELGGQDDGCLQCHRGDEVYTYGIGIVIKREWLVQNPAFGGYSAVMAYLPSKKIAISLVVTYAENGFDESGLVPRQAADPIFVAIAAQLAPDDAPAR